MFTAKDMVSLPQSLAPIPAHLSASFSVASSSPQRGRKRQRPVSIGNETQINDDKASPLFDASARAYSECSLMRDQFSLAQDMEAYTRFLRAGKRRILEAAPQKTSKLSAPEHRLYIELQASLPHHDKDQALSLIHI